MLTSASYESDDIEHTYKHPNRGLTTDKATQELIQCIRGLISSEKGKGYNSKQELKAQLMQQHSIVIIVTIALLFVAYGLRAHHGFSASHHVFEAAFLLVLFCVNIFLAIRAKSLIHSEKIARVTSSLDYFEKHNDPIQLTGIHEPLVTVTHCTVLRDGKWRDMPSSFLAEGDLVGLSEGDLSPTSMQCVEPEFEGVVLEGGQVHNMEKLRALADRSNPIVPPVVQEPPPSLRESRIHHHQERCCFVVVEAPIVDHLAKAFDPTTTRPTDPIDYAVAYALKICVRLVYFLLALSIIAIAFRAGFQDREDLVDLIIVRQTLIVLAMATVLCSNPMLHIINAIANGKLMALFDLLQERSARGVLNSNLDLFDAEDQARVVSSIPRALHWKYFKTMLRGSHPGLLHSVNLVSTLGSTTVFCCVDKDGVLSEPVWPVEEINLLQDDIISLELSPEYDNGVPTIHFNDTEWKRHLQALKPLGLNSLLNRTCCDPIPNANDRSTAQDSAKLRFIRDREKAHGAATQCVCQLGKKIGFADDAFDVFVRLKELHTIAPNRGDVDHSPYMISLVVKDDSGTLQLLTKGSPDLITSHCSSYWDGEQLRAFTEEEQHKINDLNNKIIEKGGHCIAFAYKSVKPIYKVLFEESNYNSPIVDVRVSPPQFVTPTSSNITDGYSPFLGTKTQSEIGEGIVATPAGNSNGLELEKQTTGEAELQDTRTPETGSAPATPEYHVHNRRLDKELIHEDSSSVASADTEPVSPSRKDKHRAKPRRGKEKSQSTLRFSLVESPDSSEREKGERKTRKGHGDRRRRQHRIKNDDSEEDEDGEDMKKRTPHRRTSAKKRIEDTSSSSSSSSDEERGKRRTRGHTSSDDETDSEETEERARKRGTRDDRKTKRRAKRDESSSKSSDDTSSSSREDNIERRIKHRKKKDKKKAPHSPRKGKDDDSSGEKGKRKGSIDEYKKIVERKKSLQDIKEVTEDDVSCMESDASETVTLEKLQADQIFIGMISLRELPKLHTNNFVDVLREAGVRFVLFSEEPRRSCNHFAHKLGLETDWNCCVSLRDPGPNEPHVQDEPSKMPRGISFVRDHLEQVDNVPLLVPLFCDAGPAEKQEMIKILQENGEVVCCVGSALNSANISIFSQANVSFGIEPLLRRCHNRDRDTGDSRPLLTSKLMFENPHDQGPVSTHSLAIDMNSLPCSLVYHRHTDWNEILEILQLSRQMLTNVRHSLLYYAAGCIWLAFVVLLGIVFALSLNYNFTGTISGVPLTGLQVVWMTCIILPLFSISLMTTPPDPDIMHMLNGKNLPEYRLRGISKFSWYMAIRMAPSILLTTILFLWSVETIWNSANWGNVFGNDVTEVSRNNYGKALIIAQNVLMFASVYYLALTSASFHSHTTSILRFNPFRNVVWFACTILGIVLQIAFFLISLAVTDSFSDMGSIPWYLYVVLFLWAFGLLFIDELMKKMYRKWFKRFQLELRLEFDTKLGMHSPI